MAWKQKILLRMAENNGGEFAVFIGNKYLIIRKRFEEYLDGIAKKNTIE